MILLKSPTQVDKIKKACKIVTKALDLLQSEIRCGVTTEELDRKASDFIRSKRARPSFKGYRGYPANICTSINEELVHGIPSKRALKETDIISIDVGVELDGFYGDAAKTFKVTGKVPQEAKNLIDVTYKSLELGIKEAKAGNRLFDISYAIQSFVESKH